ncbi:hypothetical protein [Halalkalibacter alkalisediminis]|uniref:Uncharacterized protein n=1 Tax=Halalkalibacter alkalisediminis TaxID=935616 RepID=A0ABV6NIX3_9BACI|nr:hypothetical protein [Halalkalibacter alkalisediminis]
MSDLVKIVVFSLFLSFLWVIPRLDLLFQWVSSHIWYSIAVAISLVAFFLCLNWIIQKRAHRHIKEQTLHVEKSEG